MVKKGNNYGMIYLKYCRKCDIKMHGGRVIDVMLVRIVTCRHIVCYLVNSILATRILIVYTTQMPDIILG